MKPEVRTRRAVTAASRPATADAESLTVEATIASDTPVLRDGYRPDGSFGPWHEVLAMTIAAIRHRLDDLRAKRSLGIHVVEYCSDAEMGATIIDLERPLAAARSLAGLVQRNRGAPPRGRGRRSARPASPSSLSQITPVLTNPTGPDCLKTGLRPCC